MSAVLKIMPLEQCGAVGKCMASPQSYASSISAYRTPSIDQIAARAMRELESARAVDVATHERNLPAIANNAAVRAHVEAVMDEIGMPRSWSQRDTKSRSRYPKNITTPAGYLTDLARECRTDDGFTAATNTYNTLLARYREYEASAQVEAERARAAAEREAAQKLAKRRADLELVTIIQRYGLPIESEWRDVLEALRGRDQRLDLAVAMEDVRGDWNEGCGAVEYALSRFTIRDNEDKDIANDVLGCTRDFEDGRVFRDTTWSYSALYASVADRQLAADVQTARSHARNES
jgi:hypothetical protein